MLALWILFATPPLAAQELELHAVRPAEEAVTLRVSGAPTERVISSLQDGMRADLELVIRAFERTDGLAGVLGDRLMAERRITKTAYYDPFAQGYVVETRRGSAGAAGDEASAVERTPVGESAEAALEELLTLWRVPVPVEATNGGDGSRYLTARVLLRPLKLVERLRIISFLIPRYTVRSRWTRLAPAGGSL